LPTTTTNQPHLLVPPHHRFEAGLYDRVLLDAPCCSERHVVQAAIEAGGIISSAAWTRQRCAQLAAQQLKVRVGWVCGGCVWEWLTGRQLLTARCNAACCCHVPTRQMLLAGLRALKPGGRLVFTTCSLAAAANDAVVLQALADSAQQVRLVPMEEWGLVGSAEVMQAAGGEATAGGGMMCLPDTAGWGPVFMALLEKRASLEQGMAGAVE
jgi:16S rRNA C967 or C1407 C5-methylase (RsmB/RsmF family)